MYKSQLPALPTELMSIPLKLRIIISSICRLADIFGFWKSPYKKAEADFQDMRLIDKIYWIYKNNNPVKQMEADNPLQKTIYRFPHVELPKGLKATSTTTFAAVGDLMSASGLENSQDFLYDQIEDLVFDKDLTYGNLESQLTARETETLVFKDDTSPPLSASMEQYNAVKSHRGKNYSMFHTACNHTMDNGIESLDKTMDQMKADGILAIGTNEKDGQQEKGVIVEKNNIRFGFISATFGLNGREVPPGKAYCVNIAKLHNSTGAPELGTLMSQLSHCQENDCDFIFASLHWGFEYELFPRTQQVEVAHDLIEAGVDAIVSHHPHVIQPVEVYRPNRDPNRLAVIAYSLGNLTTPLSAPVIALSQILNMTISKGEIENQEKTYIQSLDTIPVVQMERDHQGSHAIRIEKLEDLKNQTDDRNIKAIFDETTRYVELVHGKPASD